MRPSDEQLRDARADAADLARKPGGVWPTLTYEDGVRNALAWALGDGRTPLEPSRPVLDEPALLDARYLLPPGWEADVAALAVRPGWEILPLDAVEWGPRVVEQVGYVVGALVGCRVYLPDPASTSWARWNVMRDRGATFSFHTDGYGTAGSGTVSAVLFGTTLGEEDGGELRFKGYPPIRPRAGWLAAFHGEVIAHEVAALLRDGAVRVALGLTFKREGVEDGPGG